jgi:hypothetical protein
VLLAAPALAGTTHEVHTRALDLVMEKDTADGYKMILMVDPMKLIREKFGVDTGWVTVVDNGKVKIMIDPMFVVGF